MKSIRRAEADAGRQFNADRDSSAVPLSAEMHRPVRIPPQQPYTPTPAAAPAPVFKDTGWTPVQDTLHPALMEGQVTEPVRFAPRKTRRFLREALELVKTFCVVLIFYVLINHFLFQFNAVSGLSMYPTLHSGDRIVVNLISHTLGRKPQHGDIVTIQGKKVEPHLHDIIKRVIAVPGDHLQIKSGVVYLNEQPLDEPYLKGQVTLLNDPDDQVDIHLGEGQYYVMGDNRSGSYDSRAFGPVSNDAILGRLWFRIYPFDQMGSVH